MYTDGDPSASLAQCGVLWQKVLTGSALAMGSIQSSGKVSSGRRMYRQLATPLYAILARTILFGYLKGARDLQRSFKAFRGDVLAAVSPVRIAGGMKRACLRSALTRIYL